jgi:hypothetical protein
MTLPLPSDEQMAIINEVFLNKNVIVNAVSGSGKSTCILSMAKYINKSILQITYNKALRHEVRKKAILFGLNNIVIHTYHSLAVKYYDAEAHTDEKVSEIINSNVRPKSVNHYDIIVIDEAQDMKDVLYRFIKKFMNDLECAPIMVIMGDQFQTVYGFMGANHRFLTLSKYIYNISENVQNLPLKTSYRVTNQIAAFVNNIMLGEQRIIACKDGPPVDYITMNSYEGIKWVFNIISKNNYKPGDIFVLVASINSKGKVPYKTLENMFVENNWPVYIPMSDESSLNENVIQNKIIFSTFHQSKGRERPVVIILGFDNSYFRFNAKDDDPKICPSTLYVGATRASERLIILDSSVDNGHLPFLKNYFNISRQPYITHYGRQYKGTLIKIVDNERHTTNVTSLTKFMRSSSINEIMPLLNDVYKLISPAQELIPLSSEYQNEEVADINGVVIPMIHEYLSIGSSTVVKIIKEYVNQSNNQFINENNQYSSNKNNQIINDKNENNQVINESNQFINEKSQFINEKSQFINEKSQFINEKNDKKEIEENITDNFIIKYIGKSDIFSPKTPSCFIRLAIIYHAIKNKLLFKLAQIQNYDWLTVNDINLCLNNMKIQPIIYEYEITIMHKSKIYGNIEIAGIIDVIDKNDIYEIKCTSEITMEHKLQLLIYAIMCREKKIKKSFKLLNLRSGETWQLIEDWPIIDRIFEIILNNKFSMVDVLGDNEFIIRYT